MQKPIPEAPCEEKARLLVAYQTATEKYSTAVSELVKKMGTTPKPEYDKLHRLAEQARYESLDAPGPPGAAHGGTWLLT